METDAPEDTKILDRLQDYTDEAGDAERMQKISTGFTQSIKAIKQWLTRFGLASVGSNSDCDVQLDMDICLDSANPTLSDKKLVPDASGEGTVHDEADEEVKAVMKDPWKDKAKVFQ